MKEISRDITYPERLLPNQDGMNSHFAEADFPAALYAAICRSSGLSDDSGFDFKEAVHFPQVYRGSDPVSLALLRMLIVLSGARRALEIGTFIGVSAMALARALPADGEVVTIENCPEFAWIAEENFRRSGLHDRIALVKGDAAGALARMPSSDRFDFFFIDGDKQSYLHDFLACERLAADDAVFVIDDCLLQGDVLNARLTTEKGRGVKAFLDLMAGRNEYDRLLARSYDQTGGYSSLDPPP